MAQRHRSQGQPINRQQQNSINALFPQLKLNVCACVCGVIRSLRPLIHSLAVTSDKQKQATIDQPHSESWEAFN